MAAERDPALVNGRLCWEMTRIVTEASGLITLICTEQAGHPGKHYDMTFCLEWFSGE